MNETELPATTYRCLPTEPTHVPDTAAVPAPRPTLAGAQERRRLGLARSFKRTNIFPALSVEQQLRIASWEALPRVDKTISFTWKPDVWYRAKLTVDVTGDKALMAARDALSLSLRALDTIKKETRSILAKLEHSA